MTHFYLDLGFYLFILNLSTIVKMLHDKIKKILPFVIHLWILLTTYRKRSFLSLITIT